MPFWDSCLTTCTFFFPSAPLIVRRLSNEEKKLISNEKSFFFFIKIIRAKLSLVCQPSLSLSRGFLLLVRTPGLFFSICALKVKHWHEVRVEKENFAIIIIVVVVVVSPPLWKENERESAANNKSVRCEKDSDDKNPINREEKIETMSMLFSAHTRICTYIYICVSICTFFRLTFAFYIALSSICIIELFVYLTRVLIWIECASAFYV